MFFKFLKIYLLAWVASFLFCFNIYASDYTNTVDSVKVKSAGDNSVVVDVYINSKDNSVKPKLSSRKYGEDKYVIDLMDVTNKGNVSKDTSSSNGLVKNSDVKVGNLPGGTARVLINLDNPDLKIKEVNYHLVSSVTETPKILDNNDSKNTSTVIPVNTAPSLNNSSKPPISLPVTKPVSQKTNKPVQKLSKMDSNKTVLQSKVTLTPQIKPAIPEIPGPTVIHKKDNDHKLTSVPVKTVVEQIATTNKKTESDINNQSKTLPKPVVINKTTVEEPKTSTVSQKPTNNNINQTSVAIKNDEVVQTKQQILKENKQTVLPDTNLIAQAPVQPASVKQPQTSAVNDPGKTPVNIPLDSINTEVRTVEVKEGLVDIWGLVTSLVIGLIVIIPLIFITILIIKQFSNTGDSVGLKALSSLAGNKFKIISSTSLGQGKSIHLVEIKGRQLVIGCTNNSINILTEFDDFDNFVEENKQSGISSGSIKGSSKYKKERPPLGSFAELYKDYQSKIDEQDLEDEY